MFRSRQRRTVGAALFVAMAAIAMGTPTNIVEASSSGVDPAGFSATGLSPSSIITGAKSTTGKLAQTDPSLLGRTDVTPVHVVVKLDYDATASYAGAKGKIVLIP